MPREYYDHLISFCCMHDESLLGSKLPIDHTAMALIGVLTIVYSLSCTVTKLRHLCPENTMTI